MCFADVSSRRASFASYPLGICSDADMIETRAL